MHLITWNHSALLMYTMNAKDENFCWFLASGDADTYTVQPYMFLHVKIYVFKKTRHLGSLL